MFCTTQHYAASKIPSHSTGNYFLTIKRKSFMYCNIFLFPVRVEPIEMYAEISLRFCILKLGWDWDSRRMKDPSFWLAKCRCLTGAAVVIHGAGLLLGWRWQDDTGKPHAVQGLQRSVRVDHGIDRWREKGNRGQNDITVDKAKFLCKRCSWCG